MRVCCGNVTGAMLPQFTGSIGVITPYREQLGELKRRLRDVFIGLNEELTNTAQLNLPFSLQVNTVDGFQGQEKDIIIGAQSLPPPRHSFASFMDRVHDGRDAARGGGRGGFRKPTTALFCTARERGHSTSAPFALQ